MIARIRDHWFITNVSIGTLFPNILGWSFMWKKEKNIEKKARNILKFYRKNI